MDKCHYIWDKEVGKVLIPGCWSVVHTNDMSQCCCRPETVKDFEREAYNEELNRLRTAIRHSEKENAALSRIIKRLLGFKK